MKDSALLVAILCWMVVTVAACALPTPTRATALPAILPAVAPAGHADLRAERDAIKAQLAAVESRLRAADAERAIAPLRTLSAWAAWAGGIVALLGVVALVLVRVGVPWLPIGGKLCVGVSLAGLALAAAAVGLGQALPWLGPLGLGVLILLVIAGIGWAAATWKRGGLALGSELATYASHLPPGIRSKLDASHAARQGAAKRIVDRLLPGPPS